MSDFRNVPMTKSLVACLLFTMLSSIQPITAASAPSRAVVSLRDHNVHAVYVLEDRAEALAKGMVHGSSATRTSNALVAGWPSVRRLLRDHGASAHDIHANEMAVDRLRSATKMHKNLQFPANNITRTLSPLFACVEDRVPTYVHELDYIGRQIELDAAAMHWTQVSRDTSVLVGIWRYYKPVAAKVHGHERSTRSLDAAIRLIRDGAHHRALSKVRHGTKMVATAVDLIENLYYRRR